MIDFATDLNPEQCAAATAPGGPILVLAAAGTGKTRTLVHRVAYLVERGVPPERILLLTFTNRAAREMRERAEQIVPGAGALWSGTFHSVCARLLRRQHAIDWIKPGFTIVDEDDQKRLMTKAIKDCVKNPKDFLKPARALHILSESTNRDIELEDLLSTLQSKENFDPQEFINVAVRYFDMKRELGVLDFDDLIAGVDRILSKECDTAAMFRSMFDHVLVDEYQDTNLPQARIADSLASATGNIMAVGDDFQCIYTWRGASFENIRTFPQKWTGCKVLKLERNYRSLAPILDVANCVMRDAPDAFAKTLRPFRQARGDLPRLYSMWDGNAQANAVVAVARNLHRQGVRYRDMAVLYRAHYTSIEIQLALTRSQIPFCITSGVGVFEQLHVKDLLALLRMCIAPRDELSFMRIMELLPGVGPAGAAKIWRGMDKSFNAASFAARQELSTLLPSKAVAAWNDLDAAFEDAAEALAADRPGLAIPAFVDNFYAAHLRRQFGEDEAESRLEDLGEITSQIASHSGGLEGFLAEVALMTNLDAKSRAGGDADRLNLTTIHQAKGMEWPVVILPWLVEGVFPNARSIEEGGIDEERRLFYVAVTRAKDRLYLMCPKMRKTAEGGIYGVDPSQFLRDIPPDLVERRDFADPSAQYAPQNPRGDIYGGYGSRYGSRYGNYGSRGGGSAGWKTTWRR